MKHKLTIEMQSIAEAAATSEKEVEGLARRLGASLQGAARAAAESLKGMGRELATIAGGGQAANAVIRDWARLSAAAAPLGESLAALKAGLGGVADAFMAVLAPVAEALVPVFDVVCGAAIRLLNTLALLTARIFGSSKGLVKASGDAKGYSASLGGVAKAAKAARGELAAFDKLDVLDFSATGSTGGSGGGSTGGTGLELGGDIEVPAHLLGLLEGLLDKARALAGYFTDYFGPSIAAWGAAFEALKEPVAGALAAIGRGLENLWQNGLRPLGAYLLTDFIPTVVNTFSETFAPIVSDVAGAAIRQFGLDFEFYCAMAVRAINDLLLPGLDWLKERIVEIFASVQQMWQTYGAAIIEHWESMREKLRELVAGIYDVIILPLFTRLGALLDELWVQGIQPLWHNLVQFFGAMVEMVTAFLDEVLVPFIGWVVDTFGPLFVEIVGRVAGVFGKFIGGAMAGIAELLGGLRGLMEFLTGVFTGDWKRAWQGISDFVCGIWRGIQEFIKGIVNGIIAIINGLIGGVVAGVNAAVEAINTISVEIPDWVPGYGGSTIGFNIGTVSAPSIPYLARGAVIPPNRAFMAVLGDQSSGNNLEAPEGLIRQIFREEMAGLDTGGGDVNIRFTGNLAQLARVLKPEIEREQRRVGGSLVSGMV